MFHSVGVHKVYLFIHTNKWSATASTGNYVDFITNYNSFIVTQFVLTICLACEGLSLDFAAIAAIRKKTQLPFSVLQCLNLEILLYGIKSKTYMKQLLSCNK